MRHTSSRLVYLATLFACAFGLSPAQAQPPKDKAPPASRYMARIRDANNCVDPTTALKAELFPTTSKTGARFCVYTANAPIELTPLLRKTVPGIAADYDVLLPQQAAPLPLGAGPAAYSLIRDLGAIFRHRLEAEPSGERQAVYQDAALLDSLPWIAVIDTVSKDHQYSTGYSYSDAPLKHQHGLAMAEIINDVRCPNRETGCRDRIIFSDAFSNKAAVAGSTDVLGSMGSLSSAIDAAVEQWQGEKKASRTRARLIINLSLGWDNALYGALTGWDHGSVHSLEPALLQNTDEAILKARSVPPPVQAVYASLVYASCQGALIIAAAGNNTGGTCEQRGPMAPAVWEDTPAPSPRACAMLFNPKADMTKLSSKSPGPLVYAAGAFMHAEEPLPIARRDSTPPRVLPGFAAVAGRLDVPVTNKPPATKLPKDPRMTDPWTGTSVAAAALSGVAAMVWTHRPDLTAHGVMRLIDGAGVPSSALKIDLGKNKNQAAVRVSAFEAYEEACKIDIPSPRCGPNPYKRNKYTVTTSDDVTKLQLQIPNGNAATARQWNSKKKTTECGASWTHYYAALSKASKPGLPPPKPTGMTPSPAWPPPTKAVTYPWTRPQPDTAICPYCPIKGDMLILSLDEEHLLKSGKADEEILINPLLEFRDSDGGYISVTLGPDPIKVTKDGLEYPLSGIKVGGRPLSEVAQDYRAGTLTVFVTDNQGQVSGKVSVIEVLK